MKTIAIVLQFDENTIEDAMKELAENIASSYQVYKENKKIAENMLIPSGCGMLEDSKMSFDYELVDLPYASINQLIKDSFNEK